MSHASNGGTWRWVIFDDAEIVGRVHSRLGQQMAEFMARTVFPDASLSLKSWAQASKKQRQEANSKMFVCSKICTRLWPNPPHGETSDT